LVFKKKKREKKGVWGEVKKKQFGQPREKTGKLF